MPPLKDNGFDALSGYDLYTFLAITNHLKERKSIVTETVKEAIDLANDEMNPAHNEMLVRALLESSPIITEISTHLEQRGALPSSYQEGILNIIREHDDPFDILDIFFEMLDVIGKFEPRCVESEKSKGASADQIEQEKKDRIFARRYRGLMGTFIDLAAPFPGSWPHLLAALTDESHPRAQRIAATALRKGEDPRLVPSMAHVLAQSPCNELARTLIEAIASYRISLGIPAILRHVSSEECSATAQAELESLLTPPSAYQEQVKYTPWKGTEERCPDQTESQECSESPARQPVEISLPIDAWCPREDWIDEHLLGQRKSRIRDLIDQNPDEDAIPLLVSVAAKKRGSMAKRAFDRLCRWPDEKGIQRMIDELGHADPEHRQVIILALISINTPETVSFLLKNLRGGNPQLRADVIDGMMSRPDRRWTQPLLDAFGSEPCPLLRGNLLIALSQTLDPRVMDLLLRSADDDDLIIRSTASRLLYWAGDPRQVSDMEALLDRGDVVSDRYAVRFLARVGSDESTEVLIRCLQSADPSVRCSAIAALEHRRGDRCEESIRDCISDLSEEVAAVAFRALFNCHRPLTFEIVHDLCQTLPGVRSPTEPGDGHPHDHDVIGNLIHHQNRYMRATIVDMLALTLDERAVPYLVEASRDGKYDVAKKAELALKGFKR